METFPTGLDSNSCRNCWASLLGMIPFLISYYYLQDHFSVFKPGDSGLSFLFRIQTTEGVKETRKCRFEPIHWSYQSAEVSFLNVNNHLGKSSSGSNLLSVVHRKRLAEKLILLFTLIYLREANCICFCSSIYNIILNHCRKLIWFTGPIQHLKVSDHSTTSFKPGELGYFNQNPLRSHRSTELKVLPVPPCQDPC